MSIVSLSSFRTGNNMKICRQEYGKYLSIPAHSGFSARLVTTLRILQYYKQTQNQLHEFSI